MVEGFDVLDKIATTPTGFQDRPFEEQAIKNITIE
jgi:peptidyl-prolyl cis-trans isomerase B (cyclophilin B)